MQFARARLHEGFVNAVRLAGLRPRERILGIHTAKMPLADDVNLARIASETDRFTGADLEDVVRRAGLIAIRKRGAEVVAVNAEDFADALADSRATVTADSVVRDRVVPRMLDVVARSTGV